MKIAFLPLIAAACLFAASNVSAEELDEIVDKVHTYEVIFVNEIVVTGKIITKGEGSWYKVKIEGKDEEGWFNFAQAVKIQKKPL